MPVCPDLTKPECPEFEKPERPGFEKPERPEFEKPERPEFEKPECPDVALVAGMEPAMSTSMVATIIRAMVFISTSGSEVSALLYYST